MKKGWPFPGHPFFVVFVYTSAIAVLILEPSSTNDD